MSQKYLSTVIGLFNTIKLVHSSYSKNKQTKKKGARKKNLKRRFDREYQLWTQQDAPLIACIYIQTNQCAEEAKIYRSWFVTILYFGRINAVIMWIVRMIEVWEPEPHQGLELSLSLCFMCCPDDFTLSLYTGNVSLHFWGFSAFPGNQSTC